METMTPTTGEVAVGNPKDIRFRKQGDLVTVRIKVGNQWIDRSGGWRTIAEATGPAIELRDRLQAEYASAHPAPAADQDDGAADGDEAKPRRREKSLRERAAEEHASYCKRQRLRDGKNGNTAFKWLWKQMKDRADLPPRLQKVRFFTQVRNALLDGPLAQSTVDLYSKGIREILRRIPDLDERCIAELENLPHKDGMAEANGEPFNRSHFQEMFKRIGDADETTQIIFWIGASGGPQIVDTVFLPLSAVDWISGMVRYRRVKTGERIEFRALPPLLELLKKRRENLGTDAVYFLPEVIFLQTEQKDPACNTKGWDGFKTWIKGKVPNDDAVRGSGNGTRIMAGFLTECKIKTTNLTHKSFRKHSISFWASLGIKLKTRMRMAGHSKEESHNRYDVPAEFEIMRASEITWKYYQAIMRGEDFYIPTTTYDIYEAIMTQWSKFPELLQAILHDRIDGLRGFLQEAFAGQRALIEEQTRSLRAENARLLELVGAQGYQLAAIQDSCGKLTKHFGLM
jgi:hypothetical protein